MSGLVGVDSALDSLVSSVFTFIPWVFGFWLSVWLIAHVIGPLITDIVKARADARVAKAGALEKAGQRRAQVTKVAMLCSDFDDWLETHILALQIDCASYPEDQALADLLAELVTAKEEASDIIVRLHEGRTTNLSDEDERYVSDTWSALKQQIKEMPVRQAA